ncbi:MAG TPA: aminodeoxychorismate/anthranilate synthase component II [Ruminococcaceae bacterium]|nr:aminodeoxychorismate/anthranilate synthase component II [Oscillospiraceae bacterium]
MILLIDNFDSFSYNLYQLVGAINPDIRVIRNNETTAEEILSLPLSHIIISPGPGKPSDAGICEELVVKSEGKIPILGVCLGHQAICEAFGAKIVHAKRLMHGKKSAITADTQSALFKGLSEKFEVARYHSLAAAEAGFPSCLKVTARTDDGEIMAVEHEKYPIFGVQFHPESILTENGEAMMRNFLRED